MPTAPPLNVTATRSVDLLSIDMTWLPPKLDEQRGPIMAYTVELQPVDKFQGKNPNCSTKTFSTTTTTNMSLSLTGLDPALGYFVRVRASTDNGTLLGPPSDCILFDFASGGSESSSAFGTTQIAAIVPSVAVGVIIVGLLIFFLIRRSARKQLSLMSNNPLYSDFSKYLSE